MYEMKVRRAQSSVNNPQGQVAKYCIWMGIADRPVGKFIALAQGKPWWQRSPKGVAQQQHGQDIIEGVGFFSLFYHKNCNLSLQNLVIRLCPWLKHVHVHIIRALNINCTFISIPFKAALKWGIHLCSVLWHSFTFH